MKMSIPTMTPKAFCLSLFGAVLAIATATVTANLVIDPEDVFQTNLLPLHSSPNNRYQRFQEYQHTARQVDGLMFGSSRGSVFDTHLMETLTGTQHVTAFAVPFGSITDHLQFLEYILRDKAEHGERIKKVLLLLDSDFLGRVPWTNRNLDSFMPPEISGESNFKFWMRYLLSVQMSTWRETVRQSLSHVSPAVVMIDTPDPNARSSTSSIIGKPIFIGSNSSRQARLADRLVSATDEPSSSPSAGPDLAGQFERERLSAKPFLEVQLRELARFVSLCRQNDVRLAVAINPLHRNNQQQYLPGHLQEMVARIAQITDVWYFESPGWLESDPTYWFEFSHFKPEVATMMLRRMYADGAGVPMDFGRLLRR